MQVTITLPFQLPGLNEYVNAERSNRHTAAKMKKDWEGRIALFLRTQCREQFEKPVKLHFIWVEPNRRRDKDNIAWAKKLILDTLVREGILAGDGWAHVEGFRDEFLVGNPGVIITIREVEG